MMKLKRKPSAPTSTPAAPPTHDHETTSFTERCRTRIGSEPYIRANDGYGIYCRAWAGVSDWRPGIQTPEQYVDAAVTALQHTFAGYEATQSWFRGEGTYQPL